MPLPIILIKRLHQRPDDKLRLVFRRIDGADEADLDVWRDGDCEGSRDDGVPMEEGDGGDGFGDGGPDVGFGHGEAGGGGGVLEVDVEAGGGVFGGEGEGSGGAEGGRSEDVK